LKEYKHFVDLDDSQISLLVEAITTYPHLGMLVRSLGIASKHGC